MSANGMQLMTSYNCSITRVQFVATRRMYHVDIPSYHPQSIIWNIAFHSVLLAQTVQIGKLAPNTSIC